MREIIFDTETTGISPREGHRIIEIGAIELIDRFPTGRTFHEYLNPEDKEVEQGAFEIHGISTAQLKDKPFFRDILPGFLEFFGEGTLVAHNAPFDIGFFNAELARLKEPAIDTNRVIDTLAIARRKYPGAKNNLDALCARFGISNTHRTLHGALLDSELLAEVYIELTGGKQVGLSFEETGANPGNAGSEPTTRSPQKQRPKPLSPRHSKEEQAAHHTMVEMLGENAVWKKWSA